MGEIRFVHGLARRRLVVGCTALLCVCMITVFARSYFAEDALRISDGHSWTFGIYTLRGQVRVDWRTEGCDDIISLESRPIDLYRLSEEFEDVRLGFAAGSSRITQRGAPPVRIYQALAPMWFLVAIPSLIVAVWVLRASTRRTTAAGAVETS